jgi:hypothetical protein
MLRIVIFRFLIRDTIRLIVNNSHSAIKTLEAIGYLVTDAD